MIALAPVSQPADSFAMQYQIGIPKKTGQIALPRYLHFVFDLTRDSGSDRV
jgi:hypothetical protein